MGLELKTPDHTTLSRRSGTVEVPEFVREHRGPIHLVVDSTGLKTVGDGEWYAYGSGSPRQGAKVSTSSGTVPSASTSTQTTGRARSGSQPSWVMVVPS